MLQALVGRHGPHALVVWWRAILLCAALAGLLLAGDEPPGGSTAAGHAPQARAESDWPRGRCAPDGD